MLFVILFADVVGSTQLYDTLGNERAFALVNDTVNRLVACIQNSGGTVVKTIGDEVMRRYDSVSTALDGAINMQNQQNAGNANSLKIRIGFYFGDVIEKKNDIFGDAVNMAARVASHAKAGKIVTTGDVIKTLPFQWQERCHLIGAALFKGKTDVTKLYEVDWRESERT